MKNFIFILGLVILRGNLYAQWGNETYTEANGKILSNDVQDVYFYDTRNDLDGGNWINDSSKSWYNEPSNPSDDFYGQTIDVNRWIISDPENYLDQDNLIHCYKAATPDHDQFHSAGYLLNSLISGDFDVQIDFNLLIWNDSAFQRESSIRLEFIINDENQCKLWRYRHVDDNYWGEVWINGAYHSGREYTGNGSENPGKLRITRNGRSLRMWRWQTSDNTWQRVFLYNDFSSNAGYFRISFTNYYTEMEAEVDNFTINSGNTFFADLGSATRSTTASFPEQAILIRTDKSLDIIDASDNSLWMTFTGMTHNLGAIAGTGRFIYARNGILYTTWNDVYHGLIELDFANDELRYLSDSYNQIYDGGISLRNFNRAWTNFTPPFQIGTDEVQTVSGININGDEFIAVGHGTGLKVVSNQQVVHSSEIPLSILGANFSPDGRLYCFGNGRLYDISYNYYLPNFSYENILYFSSHSISTNNQYLFASTNSGVRKIDLSGFIDTGIIYTNSLGLDPTSSNNCASSVIFGDTLYVASTGIDGKISELNFTTDTYLKTIPEYLMLSSNCIALSGGETDEYNRNLIFATDSGVNRFYGVTGEIKSFSISIVSGNAYLEWNRVISATSYNVYRSSDPNFEISPATLLDSTSNLNYTDATIYGHKQYYYRLTWRNE